MYADIGELCMLDVYSTILYMYNYNYDYKIIYKSRTNIKQS